MTMLKMVPLGPFTLDTMRFSLQGPAGLIAMRRKSFDVLRYLSERRGQVVTKEELLGAVWANVTVGDDSLAQCISEIRRALGDSKRGMIKTVPRRGYLLDVPVPRRGGPPPSGRTAAVLKRLSPPDRPSIAVLPFKNIGQAVQQEYLADGITEDIITELSKFSELFIIARNSSFQYKNRSSDVREIGHELGVQHVLAGSIRRVGRRVRISAQLIDAETGTHRWAQSYDHDLHDLLALQTEMAGTIAAILAAHLGRAEFERTALRSPEDWRAHDYYLKASSSLFFFWSTLSIHELYNTRRLLKRSLAIDPHHGRALSTLSNTYVITWTQSLNSEFLTPAALDMAYRFAQSAVQAEPNLPQAHAQLGWVLSRRAEHDLAVASFERAVANNPNFTDYRFGAALVYAGQEKRAIRILNAHMRLDPFYAPIASAFLGLAYYMQRDYQRALVPLNESVVRAPNFRPARLWLAANYARLGQLDAARKQAAEVFRIQPNYTIGGTSAHILRFKFAKHARHMFDGLRRAGLPD